MQVLGWVALGVAGWILWSLLLGALWVALYYRIWGRVWDRGRLPGLPARDVGSMPGPRGEIERSS